MRSDRPSAFALQPPELRTLTQIRADILALEQEKRISRIEREIALMQEYRTRLTADIVTGKLDVRAAAARLP